tara:strand:+ start:321 stop:788 length:468 start_codon:yes stop_codon:yes gene_type:complete
MAIYLKTGRVKPEWTDYNGHMNLAYYIHLFDVAWETILQKFDIGEDSAMNQKRTTFAVESHTTYDNEVKVGEEVEMNLLYVDHDKKRLIYKMEMVAKNKKILAATSEVISLYVDLRERKVTEFENRKIKLIDDFINLNKKYFNPGELRLISKIKK